jgi:hypothetical protein
VKPLQINHTFSIDKSIEKELLASIGREPKDWMFGNVDAARLPEKFHSMADAALEVLNNSASEDCRIWKRVDKYMHTPEMPFGRGSIGSHTDDISRTTLLILLYCKPWVSEAKAPKYDGYGGEFFSEGSSIRVSQGGCFIFDDTKAHAWLTNSAWVFASFAVSSYHI